MILVPCTCTSTESIVFVWCVVRSFVRSFVCSFVRSLFVCWWFTLSLFVCSFVVIVRSFVVSVRLFVGSLDRWIVGSFAPPIDRKESSFAAVDSEGSFAAIDEASFDCSMVPSVRPLFPLLHCPSFCFNMFVHSTVRSIVSSSLIGSVVRTVGSAQLDTCVRF